MESISPEQLAKDLFNKKPGDPCSICILPYSEKYDSDVTSFNFEVLLTIYLEGFMNILDVIMKNKNNTEQTMYEIYKNITIEDLEIPDPWFKSFGYSVNIREYNVDDFSEKIKRLSYCRILLSFDPKDKMHFIMKGINNRYTFILNNTYKQTKSLENIYAILSKDDKFYQINFKPFKLL